MRPYQYALIFAGSCLFVFSLFTEANSIPSGAQIPTLKIGDYIYSHTLYNFYGHPERGELAIFIPPDDSGKRYIKRIVGMPGDRVRLRQVGACDLPGSTGKHPGPDVVGQRVFECGSSGEPAVALFEYRPGDSGPWRNFSPVEIAADRSREELLDADGAGVLPADVWPVDVSGERDSPTLFRERIGEREYGIVETSMRQQNHFYLGLGQEGLLLEPETYFLMGDNRDDSRDSRFLGPIERSQITGRGLVIYMSVNWRDDICMEYNRIRRRFELSPSEGFALPEFPPQKQFELCGANGDARLPGEKDSFLLRLRRAGVRWKRIGQLL